MKNGFTFIELIIVFFIVSVGILGVFAFVQNPITQARVAEQRLTATYLAQEGVEIIRNMRDTNWVMGNEWLENGYIQSNCIAKDHCEVDFVAPEVGHLIGNDNYNDAMKLCLRPDPDDRWYKTRNCENTIYTRRVMVELTTNAGGQDVLEVSVEVKWEEKGKPYDVTVQENLYDWWPSS